MEPVVIRLTPQLRRAIEEETARRQQSAPWTSRSDVIRALLSAALQRA